MADSGGSGVKNVLFTTNMTSAASYVQASKWFWLCSVSVYICVQCVIFLTAMGTFFVSEMHYLHISPRVVDRLVWNANRSEYLYFQPVLPTCVSFRSFCFCCWCELESDQLWKEANSLVLIPGKVGSHAVKSIDWMSVLHTRNRFNTDKNKYLLLYSFMYPDAFPYYSYALQPDQKQTNFPGYENKLGPRYKINTQFKRFDVFVVIFISFIKMLVFKHHHFLAGFKRKILGNVICMCQPVV